MPELALRYQMINMYLLHLDQIHGRFSGNIIDRLFDSFDHAVAASAEAIRHAQASGLEEYSASVIDDEADLVESLVGVAFVTAQTEVTATVSHVKRLHEYYCSQFPGRDLKTTSGQKPSILRTATPVICPPYTTVEVLNAFANLFKHADEWDYPWTDGTALQQQTIAVVRATGAVPACTGNLRIGAKALNVDWEMSLHDLIAIVRNWRRALATLYQTELGNLGLI